MKYRVVLGFEVIATDVSDAENEITKLIRDASGLTDLKEDLFGLKITSYAEIAERGGNGLEKDKQE